MQQQVKRGRPNGPQGETSTFVGSLGLSLRQAREKAGLTIRDASDATGGLITAMAINQWECGTHCPRLDHYLGLCMAYGLRPTKMLPQHVVNMLIGKKQKSKDIVAVLDR